MQISLEMLVADMKSEILQDVKDGFVPSGVLSFSELHDYRDANCYGGLCEDTIADALIAQFGGCDEHEGMPQGMIDFINLAQAEIDTWIKSGALECTEP